MQLGFETIGNATLILHDTSPVLATDPWFEGDAYFGSWTLAHGIPAQQRADILACQYFWFSHGHPDHLSLASLAQLKGKTILLPDHVGGRIAAALKDLGFEVRVLDDGRWYPISDHIRIACVADYNQDAILFADVGGRLLVDANDASDRGVGPFLQATAARYQRSFLLKLITYGDADMINCFDESGRRIEPEAAKRRPLRNDILESLIYCGIDTFIPFSSLHQYQRADSIWTNDYLTHVHDYPIGIYPVAGPAEVVAADVADPSRPCPPNCKRILPGFLSYDCSTDLWSTINPPVIAAKSLPPSLFGDAWDEPLDSADKDKLTDYFKAIEHLGTWLDFVRFQVAGREHVIELASGRPFDRGITFETPRGSLMQAVGWQVFDDLLIGNFTKTTVHGRFADRGNGALYPHFTPFVAKYADNGLAKNELQLRQYFAQYKRRGFFGPGPSPATQDAVAVAARYGA